MVLFGTKKLSPALMIFLATFALRLVALNSFAAAPFFLPEGDDMQFYNDWALRIRSGSLTDGKSFYGMPGYAYLLGFIYWVIGYSPFTPALIQCALEGLTSAIIFAITRRLCQSDEKGLHGFNPCAATTLAVIAALGWTFFLPAQGFSIILMPSAWVVCASWSVIWLLMRDTSPSSTHLLAVGALTGLAATIAATVLFLLPLFLAVAAAHAWRQSEPQRKFTCAAVRSIVLISGVIAGISPVWLHNYVICQEPVLLSAHSGINLWIGNNPLANGYPRMPPGIRASQAGSLEDSITRAESAMGRKLKHWEVSRFWSDKAGDWIKQNPSLWIKLLFQKVDQFWNAYQYDDVTVLKLFANQGILTVGLSFGIVAALALPGMALALFRYREAKWIAAAVILHVVALMPVFITERYRLAAVPGLLILGTLGLGSLWEKLCRREWRNAGVYCLGIIFATLWVTHPPRDQSVWFNDYYKAGIVATEAGDLGTAKINLATAYAYLPDHPEINFAMGNYFSRGNDRARAKRFYHRTLQLNGRHVGAYNNSGVIAFREGRFELAERLFFRASSIEPDDANVHYLLARSRLAQGDRAGAVSAVRRALELRPGGVEFARLLEELGAMSP